MYLTDFIIGAVVASFMIGAWKLNKYIDERWPANPTDLPTRDYTFKVTEIKEP